MTFNVGDEVQVREFGHWSYLPHKILAIQDCDPEHSPGRKWVVAAFKSDTPKVFKFEDVRKSSVIKTVVKEGTMLADGSIIISPQYPELHTPVLVHCTEVDGVVDLTHPYKVEKV